ncbi:MAG: hypothetical protein ACTS73_03910 [Arsenophonus sp. NEOnobi-MAG3]
MPKVNGDRSSNGIYFNSFLLTPYLKHVKKRRRVASMVDSCEVSPSVIFMELR